jgi:hypothetical protein
MATNDGKVVVTHTSETKADFMRFLQAAATGVRPAAPNIA